MNQAPDDFVKALADRYGLEYEIGRGGMATVYLAEDRRHHRKVAIKVLRPELAQVLGAERFLREIEISAGLEHPNILTLIDSGDAGGYLYYVMPFVDGESLRARIDREGELPIDETCRILSEVSDALAAAHAAGVVHRDIKPDNVLLMGRHAVVTDFGIAKAVAEATGSHDLTATGVALGTPMYMAPEQATADPHVDHRADIYAVGIMGYEMLTGRSPFAGSTAQAILAAHVTEAPDDVTRRRAAAPPALASAIMRCLEKKPADRWQSADELLKEIEATVTPGTGTVATAVPRRRSLSTGVIVGLVAGISAATAYVARGTGSDVLEDAQRMAVVPFAPSGQDSALSRLGRDMVVLLTRNLDGVGEISVVDASTMLARASGPQYTLAEAAALAASEGASSVIHGSMVRVGDDVLVDVGVYETGGLQELGRASVQASVDAHVALADSITWALLASVWRRGDPPTPSVAAITTRSVPALKVYLEGEAQLSRGNILGAGQLFEEATTHDSTFAWAYFQAVRSYVWAQVGIPDAMINGLDRTRELLPPRDKLLADARLAPTYGERLALSEQAAQRYPDYWPAVLAYMDRILHEGGYYGRSVEEVGAAVYRLLDLVPHFVPAWEHLAYYGIMSDQPDLIREAFDTLQARGLGPLPYYSSNNTWDDAFVEWLLLEAALRGGVDPTPVSDDDVLRLARNAQRGPYSDASRPWTLLIAPTAESGRRLGQVLMDQNPNPMYVDLVRRSSARLWMAEGQWDSALVAFEAYGSQSQDPLASIVVYRATVLGSWIGAHEADRVNAARARVEPIVAGLPDSVLNEVRWLDGVAAFVRRDSSGLSDAVDELSRLATSGSTAAVQDAAQYLHRSLIALAAGLSGNVGEGAEMLAAAESDRALDNPSRYSALHPFLASVNRLTAAEWFQETGDLDEAARILRYWEAYSADMQRYSADFAFVGPVAINQARVAESLGRTDEARRYYSIVLMNLSDPSPALQPLRDEAQQALARLSAEVN